MVATALITGASAGLGAEYARQLAARGDDLVLVARNRVRLDALATELRATGADVEVLPADLGVRADVDTVARRLADPGRPVDLLINNAGFGTGAGFRRSDVEDQQASLDVMVTAVMRLSHAAARAMAERGSGAILNVSSVAALMTSGTYSAHKAWVDTFTQGLASELRHTGVTATSVRPGLTRTEFHERANLDYSRIPAWAWIDSALVVRSSLRAVRRGRAVVTPSLRYRLMSLAIRATPRSLLRGLARMRRGR